MRLEIHELNNMYKSWQNILEKEYCVFSKGLILYSNVNTVKPSETQKATNDGLISTKSLL